MTLKKIKVAVEIAKEFIALAAEMEEAEKEYGKSSQGEPVYPSPKHRGAVRRRSMDLTRALADMRRPS